MKAIIDFSQFKSLTSGSRFSESALKLIFNYCKENDLCLQIDVISLHREWIECNTIEGVRDLEERKVVLVGYNTIVVLLFQRGR
jgi:hypothetical protein